MTRRYVCLPGLLLVTMLAVAYGATLKQCGGGQGTGRKGADAGCCRRYGGHRDAW